MTYRSVPKEGRAIVNLDEAAPPVSVTPPALVPAGTGHLRVELVAGCSAVTSTSATSPLKFLIPRPRGPSVWAYLSSYGGGLVAGDEPRLDIRLGAKTRCFLATQASTKIYRNPAARPCGHRLHARLEGGSVLVLAPDPVQVFAEARYEQRQTFHLEPEAGLVLLDWVCSGRVACEERWAFTRYSSRNDIYLGSEPAMVDSLLLDSSDGPLADDRRMGRFNCLALLVAVGAPWREVAAEWLAEVKHRPLARRSSLVCSASPLADGALLRFAGERFEEVNGEIQRRLARLGGLWEDNPWRRKG